MTTDLAGVHARALERTGRFVAGVGEGQWSLESRCAGWDVRALVNHIVSGNLWVPELVSGRTIEDVGDRLDGDVLGDDPVRAYQRSARAAGEAFGEPGALERMVAVSYGPVTAAVYCGHRLIDVLIHGWDVARSTGRDARLDTALVDACWEVVEPQADVFAGSGMFATDVTPPDDSDRQTRLLALLGRRA